ncbi:hypothetical protein MRB53_009076 [Persea americana]|uniref:Uncharacterized protein n=1 Tax=Persea americana TaxID=3435 RepID=A0ACC2LN02_PERAE|nr:hypothetical protein MRB53_009076 [Persea americana]
MALGSYQSQASDSIHRDVLSEARNSCYKARDSFYACLDKESSKKPTEIASVGLLYPVECKKLREGFEKLCRPTWVKHFDRQYCAKKRLSFSWAVVNFLAKHYSLVIFVLRLPAVHCWCLIFIGLAGILLGFS